jgi:hypothetical protein
VIRRLVGWTTRRMAGVPSFTERAALGKAAAIVSLRRGGVPPVVSPTQPSAPGPMCAAPASAGPAAMRHRTGFTTTHP